MKVKRHWINALVLLLAVNVDGAWTSPGQEQCQAAARDPSQLTDLLEDAAETQAAITVRNIMIEVLALDLEAPDREGRLAALVRAAFIAMPDDIHSLATVLGRTLAATPTVRDDPRVVSIVQRTVHEIAQAIDGTGRIAAARFGDAYDLATKLIDGASGGGDGESPAPTPTYEGQSLF